MRKKMEREINILINDKLRKLEVPTTRRDDGWWNYMLLRELTSKLLDCLGLEVQIKQRSVEIVKKKPRKYTLKGKEKNRKA